MGFLQKSMDFVKMNISRRGYELPASTFWRIFSLVNSHNLLSNPLIPIQALTTNFLLEPNSRKAEISYIIQCDVGASKNAE